MMSNAAPPTVLLFLGPWNQKDIIRTVVERHFYVVRLQIVSPFQVGNDNVYSQCNSQRGNQGTAVLWRAVPSKAGPKIGVWSLMNCGGQRRL